MRNPDLSPGFRFGNGTRNAKRISPSPPRNPSSSHDFMAFLYTVLVGKTVLVNSVLFFPLVMGAHARQLFSQKQFKSFLVSPKY